MNTPKFQIGEQVIYINDAGINYGVRTIVDYELNEIRGHTYKIFPTDTPWFTHNEKSFVKLGESMDATTVIAGKAIMCVV